MNEQEKLRVKIARANLRKGLQVHVYLENFRAPESNPYRRISKIRFQGGQMQVKLWPTDPEAHYWQDCYPADLSDQNEDW